MPRVNRDLQRRMAARRERDRERRRPNAERRYRFAAPEPAVQPEGTIAEPEADGVEEAAIEQGRVEEAAPATPPADALRRTRAAAPATSRVATPRATARPFSAYRDEYAYVYSDLRRVGAVVGSLLVILIVLYFVLPLLVH